MREPGQAADRVARQTRNFPGLWFPLRFRCVKYASPYTDTFDQSQMTIGTHFLATTLGVQVLGLTGQDRVLAYTFGMAVDVDHAIKLPYYLRAVGLRDKRGYYWRSSLQEPVALLWILPLCFFLGTIIPVIFFLAHVAMDYSVRFEKMPFYPYSGYVTRGWLTNIPDKVKEAVLASVLLVLNVVVFFGWLRV